MHTSKLLVTGLVALSLALTPILPVSAESDRSVQAREVAQTKREEKQQAVQEKKELLGAKLSENRKRVCEKRLTTIKKIMGNAQERATRQLEVFTKIADRTKAFYVEKQYTVDNYDDLVTAVDEKKQAATVAVTMSNETIDQFTCDGNDPLAIKDLFKAQVQDQNAALKAYKTSIKDLIVAVKSSKSQGLNNTTPEPNTEEAQ